MGNPTQDILDALTAVKDYNKEQITYNDSTADAFTLYATRERLDFEIEGVEVLATESVVAWVVLASDITAGTSGDLPEFGDLITDADGKVYEVLGGNAGFPPYSQLTPFGDVLRIHTAERSDALPEVLVPSRVAAFDGTNHLSDAQSVAAWQVTTSKLTLTGAFYVESVSGVSFLVTNFGSSDSTRAYYVRLSSDSTMRFGVWDDSSDNLFTVDSPAITSGQWHRWVVTLDQDANLIGISINGGSFATASFTGIVDTGASSFLLGSLYGSSFFFTGQQSGVGVYKGVILSQEQALALSNLDESGNAQPIDYSSLAKLSANGQDYDMTQNLVEWVQLDDEDNIFRKKVDGLLLTNVNSVTTVPYP